MNKLKRILTACSFLLIPVAAVADSWQEFSNAPFGNCTALEFEGLNMYMGGATGLFAVSKDGGQNWTQAQLPDISNGVEAIAVFKGRLFAATAGDIFVSTDAGKTWTSSGIDAGAHDFEEWNGNLYAATNGYGVYMFSVGSNAWVPFNKNLDLTSSGDVIRIVKTNTSMMAVSAKNGIGYCWNTSKQHWTPFLVNGVLDPYMQVYDLARSGSRIFMLTNQGGLLRSEDEGAHWDWDATDMRTSPKSLLLSGQSNLYSISHDGDAFWVQARNSSAPVKASWAANEVSLHYPGTYVNDAAEYAQQLFVATSFGIYYRSAALSVPSANPDPEVLILPNPVRSETFSIRARGLSEVRITDVMGRFVQYATVRQDQATLRLDMPGMYLVYMNVGGHWVSRRLQILN